MRNINPKDPLRKAFISGLCEEAIKLGVDDE